MRRFLIVAACAMIVGGCATRGPLIVNCKGFADYTEPLALTPLETQIRNAGLTSATVAISSLDPDDIVATRNDPVAQLLIQENEAKDLSLDEPTWPDTRPILLLSGGGQWGAFGVGFIEGLSDANAFPDMGLVTGVSTGGLQALFIGMGAGTETVADRPVLAALRRAYSPNSESEVVDRESTKALAVITGAMANLEPLKRRIEQTLCPRIYAPTAAGRKRGGCMIDELRTAKRDMLIGFIAASSGEFRWVSVRRMLTRIARTTPKSEVSALSTQCLAGATLASAAMPVFFQQVRVDGKTYYDGGVRESVFITAIEQGQRRADREQRQRREKWLRDRGSRLLSNDIAMNAREKERAIYVIRNGPTTLEPALPPKDKPDQPPDPDRLADALTAALRAEAIVVNQLEVGSLAALRLVNPSGPINLVSAEGWKTYKPTIDAPSCGTIKETPKEAMFNPAFMACLMKLGKARAQQPWTSLCRYDFTDTRPECPQRLRARRAEDEAPD